MEYRLHHVGCAVPAIDRAVGLLGEAYGFRTVSEVHDVQSQRVRVCFVEVGRSTYVELIEPSSPDSPVQGVLEKRGGGPYHLCYEVGDLDAAIRHLRGIGFLPVNKFRAGGPLERRFAFLLDPHGQLVELCEGAR